MMFFLQRYFVSGLLVWLPIWVTLLVINFLVSLMDSVFLMLPLRYQPDILLGFHFPGLGVILVMIVIFLTGLCVTNFLGKKLVSLWDKLVGHIPLVRSIYTGVKQIVTTLFSPGGQAFRKVVLVEYPRLGAWTVAFQTGNSLATLEKNALGEAMISLFVPTTPNPTSGFLLMVAKSSVVELDMSVDQALKFVISLGVVQPDAANSLLTK